MYCMFQEGMTSLDLAQTYTNDDVAQAIQQHMYLLACEEDQTTAPQFTYRSMMYLLHAVVIKNREFLVQ